MKLIKLMHFLAIIMFVKIQLMAQSMYTEEQLKIFKAQVDKTKLLGRDSIINIATKSVSGTPEVLINDEKIIISVWYNKIEVKVDFEVRCPIKYMAYDTKYYYKAYVKVIEDKAMGIAGSPLENIINKDKSNIFNTKLYVNSKEKELKIEEVLELNNKNDEKYYIDSKTQQSIIIRDRKKHYEMQLGDSFPITYKIDKISGKIYDYEDPYKEFYPTPAPMPDIITDIAGEWIEMKE